MAFPETSKRSSHQPGNTSLLSGQSTLGEAHKVMQFGAMNQSTASLSPQPSPPGAGQWRHHTHPNQGSSKNLTSSKTSLSASGSLLCVQSLVHGAHSENDRIRIIIDNPRSLDQRLPSKGGLVFGSEVYAPSIVEEAEEEEDDNYFEQQSLPLQHYTNSNASCSLPYFRFLTPQFNASYDDMTSAPGSPPDLSESRSSKSSSHASHISSSGDGGMVDVSNFEEIGLEEEKPTISTEPYPANTSRPTKRPLAPRVKTTGLWAATPVVSPRVPRRPPLVGTPSQSQAPRAFPNNAQPLSLPPLPREGNSGRRTFTSPSVNSIPFLSASEPRTRSISPARHTVAATTSSSLSLRPGNVSPRASLPVPTRRLSWQPNRKSVQELEAEYHDSDDDLPEDASLWNVPMSPRPPEDRVSPRSSHRGSPERDSGPKPIPLSHAMTAPETPPQKSPVARTMVKIRPPPPRTSSLSAAAFAATDPSSPNSRKIIRHHRAKSWTLAISELSEEAKILTQNLEHHAEETERARERQVQTGAKSARPSLDTNSNRSSLRTSTIQLPPVQKGALDFMPISKEKEAVLSRTRPSWLPPKNPREEQKHLKEYQRMMAASLEAERKREARLHMRQCQQDDTKEGLARLWEAYAAAEADPTSADSIRELWWRGVSPKARGEVWQKAVGNGLALNEESYSKALTRSREIQASDQANLNPREKFMLRGFIDIKRDAETAFPELNLFQQHGPLWQDLVDVCDAYTCYRNDVGYVYGMQLIAALLLLQLQTPSAVFILLANCLNRPLPLAFMSNDRGSSGRTYGFAMSTLAIKFPRLHTYLFGFEAQGGLAMNGEEVFEPMLRTLFASGLDVDRLSRVWDCWVFDGDRTLVRAAVALLGCLQSQIFDIDGTMDTKRRNIQDMLGWGPYGRTHGYWEVQAAGDQDAFMEEVREAGKLDYTGR